MKRIVIFADGTWNSPEQGGDTNVLRLARAVRPRTGEREQIAFYDWGLGTDRKRLSGGIAGEGTDKNIMDCYRFLVHNYEPGDPLFFFGFSRGAYTVRSLRASFATVACWGGSTPTRFPGPTNSTASVPPPAAPTPTGPGPSAGITRWPT